MITRRLLPQDFLGFYPIMKSHIDKKREEICKRLDERVSSEINGTTPVVNVYNMKVLLDYETIRDKMNIALANI